MTDAGVQVVAISVLSGSSCPGDMVAGAMFYFNSKESVLHPTTFTLPTGTMTLTAAWTSVSSLGPQDVALVYPVSYFVVESNRHSRSSTSKILKPVKSPRPRTSTIPCPCVWSFANNIFIVILSQHRLPLAQHPQTRPGALSHLAPPSVQPKQVIIQPMALRVHVKIIPGWNGV